MSEVAKDCLPPQLVEGLLRDDTVEKLDKNGELFFCKKRNHHELLVTASM